MPVPLIGAAIGAVSGLVGAKMQSNAAGNAQRAQQQATDRAMASMQQVNAPYLGLGQQAVGNLSSMIGRPQPYTQQFGGAQGPTTGFGAPGAQPFMPPGMGGMPGGAMPPQGAPQGSLGAFSGIGGLGQKLAQGPMGPAPEMGGGGMARLRAPTGEEMDIPVNSPQLPALMQRGAVRVS